MKKLILTLLCICFWQISTAQKCDTLRIDGAPNCYGCPVKALNIYKGIFKKVSESIFEPLNKATINYCDNCSPLQDWSYYNYNNKWSNNPFQFSNKTEYDWEAVPTGVPCNQEQEPALFLANVTADLIGIYGNLPSIYWEGANTLNKIYQTKQDSLAVVNKKYDDEAYKQAQKGVNISDINVPGLKQANAQKLLLFDEGVYHKTQSNFSVIFTYNKTSIDLYPNDIQPFLKKSPFKLNEKFGIPYIAFDNFVDVSAFEENEDMKQYNDYSKKPTINSRLGKQYVTWVQLGQNIPHEKEDKIRLNADYSVYNFIVTIKSTLSFEKNHEVLNSIDWNKLYTLINTKKL